MESLLKGDDVYGLLLFGDGTMVHRMPLMNILVTGVDEPSALLAIVDCKFLSVPFFDIIKSLSYPFFCQVWLLLFFKVPNILKNAS
jgi:hypothetical protein